MQWCDLMIDLETMGLPPSGALVSIGACLFDVKTRQIGPTFHRAVNLATSVRAGMVMDPGTVVWWLGQNDKARQSITWTTYDINEALADFRAFIEQHSSVDVVRPWGNGAAFDLTVLNTAYKCIGQQAPWKFWNERCFRSVKAMYPAVEYNVDEKGEGAHNALEDAKFQAQHLFKIADWVKARNGEA